MSVPNSKLLMAVPQLPTGDIDVTEKFFEERLGFQTLAKRQDHGFLMLERDKCEIQFWLATNEDEARWIGSSSSCYIRVIDIEALFSELKSRGAPFRFELTKQPWGMAEMQVDGPYGIAIRFGEPIP